MEQVKNTQIDFRGQRFFIGLDVHKKNWRTTIRSNKLEMKTFSMEAQPEILENYLKKRYPGGEYYSVYEAGFSGYWIDESLKKRGIKNIVVNPADVPTTNKEKLGKSDPVDSRKLARELENGTLRGIYIPSRFEQELRTLCRLRGAMTRDLTRVKNRIKGYLNFYGIPIPEKSECHHWSGKFIKYLEEKIEFAYPSGQDTLKFCIEELKQTKDQLSRIVRELRRITRHYGLEEKIKRMYGTIPGVGYITAITLYTELMTMKRFRRTEELASYVGLVPAIRSSGEREVVLGITIRDHQHLRNILVESAWVAIREDEAIYQYYCSLIKRMNNKRAIISVARKLLSRIRSVWLKEEDYIYGIVR